MCLPGPLTRTPAGLYNPERLPTTVAAMGAPSIAIKLCGEQGEAMVERLPFPSQLSSVASIAKVSWPGLVLQPPNLRRGRGETTQANMGMANTRQTHNQNSKQRTTIEDLSSFGGQCHTLILYLLGTVLILGMCNEFHTD